MIALWLAGLALAGLDADVGEQQGKVRELKAEEQNLLDRLDGFIEEKLVLARRLEDRRAELAALRGVIAEQRRKLDEEQRRTAALRVQAQAHARQLDKLLRGRAARFVLAADGLSESLRRVRLVQKWVQRDRALLATADTLLQKQRDKHEDWQRNVDYASDLVVAIEATRADLDEKSLQIERTLTDVREQRYNHEQVLYDLKEAEARMQSSATLALVSDDPFLVQRGRLLWPVSGSVLSPYGRQIDREFGTVTFHSGLLISADVGEEVDAVYDGRVVFAGSVAGFGKLLIVEHSPNYYSVYGQLGVLSLGVGESVRGGQKLGSVGRNEGGVAPEKTGLYFELRRRTIAEDPRLWLSQ